MTGEGGAVGLGLEEVQGFLQGQSASGYSGLNRCNLLTDNRLNVYSEFQTINYSELVIFFHDVYILGFTVINSLSLGLTYTDQA